MEEKIKRLEKEIAEKLDDEQWNNWQEVLGYISEQNKIIDEMAYIIKTYNPGISEEKIIDDITNIVKRDIKYMERR